MRKFGLKKIEQNPEKVILTCDSKLGNWKQAVCVPRACWPSSYWFGCSTYLNIPSIAKATRLFCPPDRLSIGRNANSPETPNEPSCLRYSSSGFPGNDNAFSIGHFQSDYVVDQRQEALFSRQCLPKPNSEVVTKFHSIP